jgi:DNA-binding response OmpR family regulator
MILVVEDNEDSRKIIETILESADYEVAIAVNGRDGVAIAREKSPELIIMDIMMPEMDGISALKELRDSPQTSRIPVILLTARTEDEDVLSGYKTGADYYMTKPFTSKQLLYGVRLVLGRAEP